MSASPMKSAYAALHHRPLGKKLFGAAVALKAPYFCTIRPTFVTLKPGHGEVLMRDRWGVRNHLGSVHAIACCNLAELVAGTTLDVSLPDTHRWIPKGMQVTYLRKARGTLRGIASVEKLDTLGAEEAREVAVAVDIIDPTDTVVVHADITMWVSPRPPAGPSRPVDAHRVRDHHEPGREPRGLRPHLSPIGAAVPSSSLKVLSRETRDA